MSCCTLTADGDPDAPLPAWPMHEACKRITQEVSHKASATEDTLISALREGVDIFYNTSGKTACFSLDPSGPAAGNVGPWDYQFCTELDGKSLSTKTEDHKLFPKKVALSYHLPPHN